MARWIMIALTVTGLVMAILTRSPGVLGLALVMTVVGLFGTVFSLAADRISASSRPDSTMLSPDVLMAVREKAKAEASREAVRAQSADASRSTLGGRQS